MNTLISKTWLIASISIGMLGLGASLSYTAPEKKGQDVAGRNCERIDSPESSTFGKCESVCKDLVVVPGMNGYVCKAKTAIRRPNSNANANVRRKN